MKNLVRGFRGLSLALGVTLAAGVGHAGQSLPARTINGEKPMIDARNGVNVNDAIVEQADIMASNGVIHVTDKVILPGS